MNTLNFKKTRYFDKNRRSKLIAFQIKKTQWIVILKRVSLSHNIIFNMYISKK